MGVLLGPPALYVMIDAEAQVGIYCLMCTQQWRPKPTNFGHTKKFQYMEHKPTLQLGSDRRTARYAYHKAFRLKFPDNCEWQKRFNPHNKGWLVWHTDGSKTNKRHWCWGIQVGLDWEGDLASASGSMPRYSRLKYTRWFKYDRDKLWLVYTQIVPVIFQPPCTP
jgi:hypothetical protein